MPASLPVDPDDQEARDLCGVPTRSHMRFANGH